MKRHFIMATAGHVDHGKSAIVQALTGFDPDRLPDEKARGITIELGFAKLSLTSKKAKDEICLGIIDVPGHEDFVRNMTAGLGCVHLGMIVVAADDGWMPQTEEHLQLLEYLGVKQVIVALNKMDLARGEGDFLKEVIADELSDSSFSNAAIIPISAKTKEGFDELKGVIVEEIDRMPNPKNLLQPRLFVDRSFSVKGHGTIVTGTLIDGEFEINQAVCIQPKGIDSRIRSLQSFGEGVDSAQPGSRVAMNLAGVSIGKRAAEGVERGDVVMMPDAISPTRMINCVVKKSARLRGKSIPSAKPLKHGTRIRLHHGSGNTPGRIFFLDKSQLESGAILPAEIRLEREAMLLEGDRFALRDWSESHTLAGGWIVESLESSEPLTNARRFRSLAQRHFLQTFVSEGVNCRSMIKASFNRDKLCQEVFVLKKSAYGRAEIDAVIDHFEMQNQLVRKGNWIFEISFWRRQIEVAKAAIDHWHKAHCELLGMPLPQLRATLDHRFKDAFSTLLKALSDEGCIINSTIARRASHQISLPQELELSVHQIRRSLAQKPMEPLGKRQLLQSDHDLRALRFLAEKGEVMEIGDDLIFQKEGWERIRGLILQYLKDHGEAKVSDLRDFTGMSRRIILPVLEAMDAGGWTIRDGDLRRLKSVS